MNWEELGFKSKEELDQSIKRVKERAKGNDLLHEIKRRREAQDLILDNGGIDFKGLEEGARLEELDRLVASKLYEEKEQAKVREHQEATNKVIKGLADKLEAEDKEKAEAELRKAEAKQKEELQKEIYSKHNVKTDKQIEEEEAYKSMLDGLKL